MKAFGRVDILVNNAVILCDKALKNIGEAGIKPVIDVHLYGTIWCPLVAWNLRLARKYGRVVNTTSAAGLFGNFGQTNYGAAKMGIVGFSHVAPIEGAKTVVRINVIAPAARTRMTEQLLGPMAEELAPELVAPVSLTRAAKSAEFSTAAAVDGWAACSSACAGLLQAEADGRGRARQPCRHPRHLQVRASYERDRRDRSADEGFCRQLTSIRIPRGDAF